MLAPSPHTHVLLLLRKALFAVRQRLSFAYFICEAMRYLDGREAEMIYWRSCESSAFRAAALFLCPFSVTPPCRRRVAR